MSCVSTRRQVRYVIYNLKSAQRGYSTWLASVRVVQQLPPHLERGFGARWVYTDTPVGQLSDDDARFVYRHLDRVMHWPRDVPRPPQLTGKFLEETADRGLRIIEVKEAPLPPRLIFGTLLRLGLTASLYARYVAPAVADMHEEYFACIARGDKRGARIAVIKGNLYAVPGWLWALLAQLLLKLIG